MTWFLKKEFSMSQLKLTLLAILILASQTAFAQGLSKKCVDELMAISEKDDFELQGFIKELTSEVVSVKAQLKLPFGKPADSKVTDIGITVGCLKAFPEKPQQIQTMFKDIGLETAKRVVANELEMIQTKTGERRTNAANSNPALKECDMVFNTNKKFCYDGEIYDLCDSMAYNPTTHICSGDAAYRALCNGTQYNPLTQKCEDNIILTKCDETFYNFATHYCKDSTVLELPKCGEIYYNPATHVCKNNTALPKCGTNKLYNPATHGCRNNTVLPKCGEILYDTKTHGCRGNVVFSYEKELETPENYEEEKRAFSLGFRIGFNSSHVYETYKNSGVRNSGSSESSTSFQMGLAFDWGLSNWLYLQPNVMFIRKGADYNGYDAVWSYLEFPLLISLKFSAVRLNMGPYFSIGDVYDGGASIGGGFDIGSFYIGMFYNTGWADISKKRNYETYNRTLGFSLGYNL
jgi:hypothetical protein